ncbi:MAG TPA: hypothetical protein VHM70_11030 [Polyangiaceae bacterium]|jgi:hypothetical protein|nr:hypothetical protein [Polyangiaceae bacterium]
MTKPINTLQSTKEMIAALRLARDEARVQLHLLSLDARERWDALEAQLIQVETRLQQGLEQITENGLETMSRKVEELIERVRRLLRETRTGAVQGPPAGSAEAK